MNGFVQNKAFFDHSSLFR